MTEERKVQIGTTVDATGARAGFDAVKQGARDMAREVTQAGQQAAKGIDGIGNGGADAATKVDKAASSIVSSVQRATAALQAGEKGSAKYYEALANQRGVSADVLRPYLDQLRKAEEAQRVASGGLQTMGVSAAQTAAALRGVPAQLTDIAVSLQGGQAPLTVLLQQGGQLKDMFGGIAPAARALGSALLSLVNPATIAAASVGAVAIAYFKGAAESSEFNKQIALTGNITGTTSGQLGAMAANVSKVVGTQAQAAEVLALLVGTGRVAVGSMQGATEAIVAMSKASGIAVDQLVKDFAELGKAPTESIYKLNEQYHFLTQSTYAQIKALEDQGRKEEAAALAQKTYEAALKDRAAGVTQSLGLLERGWNSLGGAAKTAWDFMLGVGRADDVQAKIAELEDRVRRNQALRKLDSQSSDPLLYAPGRKRVTDELTSDLAQLERYKLGQRLSAQVAEKEASNKRAQEAAINATKEIEAERKARLTGVAKMEQELKESRDRLSKIRQVEPNSPLLNPALIASDEAAIRAKYADKGAIASQRREVSAAQAEIQKALALVDDLSARTDSLGLSPQYTEQAALLARAHQAGAISLDAYNQAMDQLLQRQPFAVAQAKEQAEAEREWQAERKKRFDEIQNQYAQEVRAAEGNAKTVQDRVQQLADEDQALSRSRMLNISLAEAIEDVRIARLTEARAAAVSAGNQEVVDALNAEIEARRQLKVLTVGKEAEAVAADAAKQAEQDWKRSAQIIEQSLTDALMRGFESGKGFMRSLRDSAVNMFKTMVLRPVISAVVSPLAGGVTSALGFGGVPGSAQGSGGSGVGGLLSNAQSIYSLATGGLTSSIAGAIGSAGSLFGSSALTSFAAGMQGSTLAAGLAGPTTAGATGAMGAGASFAAAIPYLAPLAIIGMIAGSLGAFNGPSYHTGAAIGINADGTTTGRLGKNSSWSGEQVWGGFTEADKRGGAAFAEPLMTIGTTIVKGLNETFKTFGLDRRVTAFTGFGADGNDESEGVLRILGNDGSAVGGRKKYSVDASKGLQEYLADAGRLTRDALVSADIPGWAKSILTELGASPELQTVAQAVQKINEAQAALVNLGQSMSQISGLSGSTVSALVQAFGSVDGLIASTKSFFDLYYTDAEKVADSTRRMTKALADVNLALPKSKEELRALVEGMDLTTNSGRKAYAVLLQVAPQFSSTVDAVKQMTTDVQSSFLAMTQGIVSEIDRIKGLAAEQSAGGVAELQARFAVATAQARSGDQTAVDELPKLSQALLKAAEATAGSSLELRAIQAQTLASLQATLNFLGTEATKKAGIPGFASGGDFGGGWRVVGEVGRELEATGPARIFNADQTARILSGIPSDGGATAAALAAMQQTLAGLREDQRIQAAQIAANTGKVARLLESVTPDGNSLSVTTT